MDKATYTSPRRNFAVCFSYLLFFWEINYVRGICFRIRTMVGLGSLDRRNSNALPSPTIFNHNKTSSSRRHLLYFPLNLKKIILAVTVLRGNWRKSSPYYPIASHNTSCCGPTSLHSHILLTYTKYLLSATRIATTLGNLQVPVNKERQF